MTDRAATGGQVSSQGGEVEERRAERNVDEEEDNDEERRKKRCLRGQRCSVVTWQRHKVTLWSHCSAVTTAAPVGRAGSPSGGSLKNGESLHVCSSFLKKLRHNDVSRAQLCDQTHACV